MCLTHSVQVKHGELAMDSRTTSHRKSTFAIPTRRTVLTGAAALAASNLPFRSAKAATELNAVWWGGPWIEGIKAITAKQNDVTVDWQLHAGGSAGVLPAINSAWPSYHAEAAGQFTPGC